MSFYRQRVSRHLRLNKTIRSRFLFLWFFALSLNRLKTKIKILAFSYMILDEKTFQFSGFWWFFSYRLWLLLVTKRKKASGNSILPIYLNLTTSFTLPATTFLCYISGIFNKTIANLYGNQCQQKPTIFAAVHTCSRKAILETSKFNINKFSMICWYSCQKFAYREKKKLLKKKKLLQQQRIYRRTK